jgi:hypothetical protein
LAPRQSRSYRELFQLVREQLANGREDADASGDEEDGDE